MYSFTSRRIKKLGRTFLLRKIAVICTVGLSLIAGFAFGVVARENGFTFSSVKGPLPFSRRIMSDQLNEGVGIYRQKTSGTGEEDIDFGEFWKVWELVNQEHIDGPFEKKKLMYGAIKGMIAATGDHHTMFFTEEEAKQFDDVLSGNFEGIGAELEKKGDSIIILSVLKKTPAEKYGLLPGDIILAVDKVSIAGMSLQDVVYKKIRGPSGSSVMITVLRNDKLLDFKVPRSKISVPSLELSFLPLNDYHYPTQGQVAYLQIYQFGTSTVLEYDRAVKEILLEQPIGLILDLRFNGGGSLQGGIHIAKSFFSDGIVMKREMKEETEIYKVQEKGVLSNIPLVALINGFSASAAEIVASALQDRGRATLVGTQSFGKGTVQDLKQLAHGTEIKITTSRWTSPTGRIVSQEKPIVPDVLVEIPSYIKDSATESPTKSTAESDEPLPINPPMALPTKNPLLEDPQLKKALEVLLEKKQNTTPTVVITDTEKKKR